MKGRCLLLVWVLLTILAACDDGARQRLQLKELERMNRADSLMTNDSLALDLADWFDRHGTPNEQLRAHYILGRTYADLGEAPQAIEAYNDAIERADTTSQNCDYATLARVYTQMATCFHRQLLFSDEIEARHFAIHYFLCERDTFNAIYHIRMTGGTYILMNMKDSADMLLNKAMELYRKHGYDQDALQTSTMLMHLYMDIPNRLLQLNDLINAYDSGCLLFDKNRELPPSMRQYYYYKGKYYEGISNLDSAEYYYRKVYRDHMTPVDKNPMYKGLLNVFTKRSQADSISKYSILYCQANDSSIAVNDRELTAQLSASYNYSRYQKLSIEKERESFKLRYGLLITLFVSSLVFMAIFVFLRRYKQRQQAKQQLLRKELAKVTDLYNKNNQTLRILKESHQVAVDKLADAQQDITDLNQSYNHIINSLEEENASLKHKIEELSVNDNISQIILRSKQFAETSIAKRFFCLANNPKLKTVHSEWDELINTASDFFPVLLSDLNNIPNITAQEVCVAILVAMNIRTDDIARLMNVSGQRITNVKASLNGYMFGIKTARPFHNNIRERYGVYVISV